MNLSEPTLKPGDDLDSLLRAFFRSQMPKQWPTPRLPAPRPIQPKRNRSRWALAASIGLLLLGSLLLPARLASDSRNESAPGGPLTSDTKERREMEQKHKDRQLHPKPDHGLGDEMGDF